MQKRRRQAKTYDLSQYMNVEAPTRPAEAAKKEPRIRRWRARPMAVCLVVFVIYAVVILITQQIRLMEFERNISRVSQEIASAQSTQNELNEQIDYMSTDAYIEQIAREKLGLIRPGEIPYITIPSDTQSEVTVLDKDAPIVDVED